MPYPAGGGSDVVARTLAEHDKRGIFNDRDHNQSYETHALQVAPAEFAANWNAAQLLLGPQLALEIAEALRDALEELGLLEQVGEAVRAGRQRSLGEFGLAGLLQGVAELNQFVGL